jgi:hypothetical protein
MFAGCFAPDTDVDTIEPGTEPPGQLFGADGGVNGTCGTVDPSPLTTLHIVVRTSPYNGRYAPRNVGAIWIETAAGAFVKTIERWGKTRARYITRWNASSGGNVVDAVTSATLSSHITHDRTWDLTDKMMCKVAAGDYRVMVEHTDYNGTGALLTIPFTKGQTPVTQMPAETTYFHNILLELQ